jgi:hypothetical protein
LCALVRDSCVGERSGEAISKDQVSTIAVSGLAISGTLKNSGLKSANPLTFSFFLFPLKKQINSKKFNSKSKIRFADPEVLFVGAEPQRYASLAPSTSDVQHEKIIPVTAVF